MCKWYWKASAALLDINCLAVCLFICVCMCAHASQGIAELKESAADESLVISWRQTQRQRSGLSCMAVHPSHWTISIDALPSEDERTEVHYVMYL